LLRTCDGVGACMAVPRLSWVPEALNKGNTLRKGSCVTGSTATSAGGCGASQPKTQILGVELTDESIRLADLPAARTRTVVVLGNESHGIPPEAMDMLDVASKFR